MHLLLCQCFNTVRKIAVFRKKLALKLFNMNKNFLNSSKGSITKPKPCPFFFYNHFLNWACCKVYVLLSNIPHWIFAVFLVIHCITKWWGNCGFTVYGKSSDSEKLLDQDSKNWPSISLQVQSIKDQLLLLNTASCWIKISFLSYSWWTTERKWF